MELTLAERIVELHRHLGDGHLPHAFGGAVALAFCTADPRGTKDIDVNVFVGVGRLDEALAALPGGVMVTRANRTALQRDGQARLWWDDVPVDLFLSNHPFHGRAEHQRRAVPFAGVDALPVLACMDLAVFKAFFARPKDAVDVAAMVDAGTVDLVELGSLVRGLLGDDSRGDFLADVERFAN